MKQWKELSSICSVADWPAKAGLVQTDQGVVLIDSGSDQDAGRKLRRLLEEKGWKLRAIVNTHSNADHIGGNQYLQKQTGCQIFSPDIENALTELPVLEPAFLYGGYPFRQLRCKFLMAKPSTVCGLDHPDFPEELEPIPLPGHFFNMYGYRTQDNIVFLADCVASQDTLDKYGIPFIYDVDQYLKTLDAADRIEAKLFVPSHAPVCTDIRPLTECNRQKIDEIAEHILRFLEQPAGFEEILQHLFQIYDLKMNAQQYVLVGSTVRSFLSWLCDQGKIEFYFKDSRMYWKQTEQKGEEYVN